MMYYYNYIKSRIKEINKIVQEILEDEIFNSPLIKFPKIVTN
jgi:hypothetical protein